MGCSGNDFPLGITIVQFVREIGSINRETCQANPNVNDYV
jgi:hypothetical protein